jgi:hypothetical protein
MDSSNKFTIFHDSNENAPQVWLFLSVSPELELLPALFRP